MKNLLLVLLLSLVSTCALLVFNLNSVLNEDSAQIGSIDKIKKTNLSSVQLPLNEAVKHRILYRLGEVSPRNERLVQ